MAKHPVVIGAMSSAGILIGNEDGKLLLQLRGFDEEEFAGTWSFPGGRMLNASDHPDATVLVKLLEDLGFSSDPWRMGIVDQVTVVNGIYEPAKLTLLRYSVPVNSVELGRYKHMAPAWGFFTFEDIVMMCEKGLLHPTTAFAVEHIQRVKAEQGRCLLTGGQD